MCEGLERKSCVKIFDFFIAKENLFEKVEVLFSWNAVLGKVLVRKKFLLDEKNFTKFCINCFPGNS